MAGNETKYKTTQALHHMQDTERRTQQEFTKNMKQHKQAAHNQTYQQPDASILET